MIRIKKITVNKYKPFETEQSFEVDKDITVLVGKNESGKTAILEAIAKTNYFEEDNDFKFNSTLDYPRKEEKSYKKSGKIQDVVTSYFEIDEKLLKEITESLGEKVFTEKGFSITVDYNNKKTVGDVTANQEAFLKNRIKDISLSAEEKQNVLSIKSVDDIESLISQDTEKQSRNQEYLNCLESLQDFFNNDNNWNNSLAEYIYRVWLKPHIPKFLYYDEYYALPSCINIADLRGESLEKTELKTSKALFELSGIEVNRITSSNSFEEFKSELEATGNEITRQFLNYWNTNQNLELRFDIDKQLTNNHSFKHILHIRVYNHKHKVTLPLSNRSKGFNWFFSFFVWFSKIQEDQESNYVLLLDEPGLNLHASAQADLLRFIEELSKDYQIIYTTHSPFMIEPGKLQRVRTVVEKNNGTHITDSIQEKDPDTLFPLQAALGYDIAQNLFISKNNLLVEGPADLVFINAMSHFIEREGKIGLKDDITIVPIGGLDKVVTFISLLRATKLNTVCLLDTFTNNTGKQRIEHLVKSKIIKEKNIKFFDEFTDGDEADIEDLFDKNDYLKLFNESFPEYKIQLSDLDSEKNRIVHQLNKKIGKDRFNHYKPANLLASKGYSKDYFSETTLIRFERLFKAINGLF